MIVFHIGLVQQEHFQLLDPSSSNNGKISSPCGYVSGMECLNFQFMI